MVAMPVAPGTVLAGGTGQGQTLAARHFSYKLGCTDLDFR